MKEIVKEEKKYTLTGLLNFCLEKFKTKENGEIFTISDVQGYVKRGKLPKYLGGNILVKVEDKDLINVNPMYEIK